MGKVCVRTDGGAVVELERKLGALPVMVRSVRCHLRGLTQKQLVERHEEAHEAGGYFICNGNERAIRLLIVPRRQHMLALVRPTFVNRGADFTDRAVQMRCVRDDQSSVTVALHYLTTGNCMLRLTLRKSEYFVPVALVLKALRPCTDRDIYARACGGDYDDAFVCDRVEAALRALRGLSEPVGTQAQCLAYLGRRFRSQLGVSDAAGVSDDACGRLLIERQLLVHLRCFGAKWEVLLTMLHKLYALAAGRIAEDNADSLVNQEVLLPGHLLTMLVKERLGELLQAAAAAARRELEPLAAGGAATAAAGGGAASARRRGAAPSAHDPDLLKRSVERAAQQVDVGKKVDYFMATGNLVSQSGLDLQQTSGYTIVAERLNYWRFISHFRSVHRGSFFAQMRTTTVRKLLPDSWGFLCPVHTPDGSPCGLLNHLAARCELRASDGLSPAQLGALRGLLGARGMVPAAAGGAAIGAPPPIGALAVVIDGELAGYAPPARAAAIAKALRTLKVLRAPISPSGEVVPSASTDPTGVALPDSLEIVHVPPGASLQWPVLALFSGPARPLRPVKHLATGRVELLAPWEQIFLGVALADDEARADGDGDAGSAAPGVDAAHTHAELSAVNMLSVVASLTPFCDHNQSPRNMYQCQMGKQTMGTPFHALPYRTDNKAYRLQTPQTPLVSNEAYAECSLDEYPSGCNAVVAVLAYTGYDMEDAMVLNKASYERGFGHASVYATKLIDLNEKGAQRGAAGSRHFCNIKAQDETPADSGDVERIHKSLGEDGLPEIGQTLRQGEPFYCVYDTISRTHSLHVHKNAEPAVVEEVRLLGAEGGAAQCTRACIKLRYNRNPIPGDKFSSRHGQKGVLSRLWPAEDMPFTESGLVPDVLINPHAFPSRMTVGMLIESLAAKSGALHGAKQDGTPFRFGERQPAAEHFGQQLLKAGYSHAGSEPMYSGIYGGEMQMDIYIGVVYYQRLRCAARATRDRARTRAARAHARAACVRARRAAGTWCRTSIRCAPRAQSTRRRASRSRGARCTAASGSARWSAIRSLRTAPPICCTTASSTARTSTARWRARAARAFSRRTCSERRTCAGAATATARPRRAPCATLLSAVASRAACASCACPTCSPTWPTSSPP